MKRILLIAALFAAPVAQAQNYYDDRNRDPAVTELQDDLERLRRDPDVVEFAANPLAKAEAYIEDLANAPQEVTDEEIVEAERLLQRVELVAERRSMRPDNRSEREIVVVQQPREREVVVVQDPRTREAARRARDESERSRAAAEEERERALAAQMEAEQERAENARLRAELGQAQTRVTDRGVVLTLGDVLFEVGKSDLKAGAARSLDKLVAAMRRDPDMTVTIEGHTDSTGRHVANIELSKRRAHSVRSYLASRGVTTQRLKAAGLGPDYPVATNATAEGRQQNRRVELVVQNDGFDD